MTNPGFCFFSPKSPNRKSPALQGYTVTTHVYKGNATYNGLSRLVILMMMRMLDVGLVIWFLSKNNEILSY